MTTDYIFLWLYLEIVPPYLICVSGNYVSSAGVFQSPKVNSPLNSTHRQSHTHIEVFNGNLSSRNCRLYACFRKLKITCQMMYGVFYNLTNSRVWIRNSLQHFPSFWYLKDIFCARLIFLDLKGNSYNRLYFSCSVFKICPSRYILKWVITP